VVKLPELGRKKKKLSMAATRFLRRQVWKTTQVTIKDKRKVTGSAFFWGTLVK